MMGILDWLKEQTSPEAKLRRMEAQVKREEAKAALAKAELPLLIRKDQAQSIIKKRDDCRQTIRDKKMSAFKSRLKKMNEASNFGSPKLKSPSDRLYKN